VGERIDANGLKFAIDWARVNIPLRCAISKRSSPGLPPQMSLENLASDYVVLVKNEEAINELQRLGIKLPSSLSRLLFVIDNRRTFKQCVMDPRLNGATDTDESLRSLIRLGFVNAIPASSAPQASAEPNLTATTRLKVVAAVNDPASNRTQGMKVFDPASAAEARAKWESEVDARHMENVKATLILDLRRILGKDVSLVQGKILSASNGEELIKAVTSCARVLETAVSKEASDKLMDAFRRHFA
jgi:hypothetical protein